METTSQVTASPTHDASPTARHPNQPPELTGATAASAATPSVGGEVDATPTTDPPPQSTPPPRSSVPRREQ